MATPEPARRHKARTPGSRRPGRTPKSKEPAFHHVQNVVEAVSCMSPRSKASRSPRSKASRSPRSRARRPKSRRSRRSKGARSRRLSVGMSGEEDNVDANPVIVKAPGGEDPYRSGALVPTFVTAQEPHGNRPGLKATADMCQPTSVFTAPTSTARSTTPDLDDPYARATTPLQPLWCRGLTPGAPATPPPGMPIIPIPVRATAKISEGPREPPEVPGPLEQVEMAAVVVRKLVAHFVDWTGRTPQDLPEGPPSVPLAKHWKLPAPPLRKPAPGDGDAHKARYLQECVTVLMLHLDSLEANAVHGARRNRRAVLQQLTVLASHVDAWADVATGEAAPSSPKSTGGRSRRSHASRRSRRSHRSKSRSSRHSESGPSEAPSEAGGAATESVVSAATEANKAKPSKSRRSRGKDKDRGGKGDKGKDKHKHKKDRRGKEREPEEASSDAKTPRSRKHRKRGSGDPKKCTIM